MYYKKAVFLAVLLPFFILIPIWAEYSESQDRYESIADYLNNIYGIDDNAGLTTFPILNIPMGGRSEGMATAFASIADDVSFIEYNPAGSSMLPKSELAFFHNNWIGDANLEGVAYAVRYNNLGLATGAKWLYLPFTEYNIYGERVSNGYYSEGVAILNISYNFLQSYYFSGLSVGINLKGAFRLMPDFTDNDDVVIPGSGMSQSAVMGMADIGFLTRFNLLKFYGSRENNASAALVIKNLGPPALDEPLPTVINAAFSYKPIRPLIIAFDFNLPINTMYPELSEKPYMALGLSASITNFLSMRSGLMIKAGSSRVSIGSAITLEKIAIDVNYTLDLLTQLRPMNRVSIGVRFDLGDGGRKLKAEKVDELYILGLEAYAGGNHTEARYYWEETLKLDPRFNPAKEGLTMLNNRAALNERIEDLFWLD